MTTLRRTCFVLLATGLLASSAGAQSVSKPLNLKLPPGSEFPTSNASDARPASASTAPGVYYGDTSGVAVGGAASNPDAAADSCDDATYNKPQVHGSVAVGVAAGNRVSGNYQSGTVNVTRPLGDCRHPTGILIITAHASQSRFDYSRRRH
jgi:heterodisulfide reductase subunit A-like polyferredoxin